MKHAFFVFFLLISCVLYAQTEVSTTLSRVVVYLRGAQLIREGRATVPAGTHTLRFTGLSAQVQPESVTVGAQGEFTILSVEYQVNYLNTRPKPAEVTKLEADIKALNERYEEDQIALQTWKDEEALILSNKSVAGSQTGLVTTQLEAAAQLYRTRLTEIRVRILELTRQQARLAEEKQKLTNQLNELNAKQSNPNLGEVLVTVESSKTTTGEFSISYYVADASWSVRYDLHVADLNAPIALDYKAVVQQNTGELWEKVKLVLSNGDPLTSNQRPVLSPWFLQQMQTYAYAKELKTVTLSEKMNAGAPVARADSENMPAASPRTNASESGANIVFEIEEKYTIETGRKPKTVTIARHNLKTSYVHYAVPRLQQAAFLVANVTDWNDLYLMPGQANIYLDGSYTGQTYLNPQIVQDTLEISLGRDQAVSVKRTRQALKDRNQLLGIHRIVQRGWDIDVRNNRRSKINLILRDQIPLSTREDTKIELLSDSGARLEEATGFLNWEIELKPGQSERKSFAYSIKYPKSIQYAIE